MTVPGTGAAVPDINMPTTVDEKGHPVVDVGRIAREHSGVDRLIQLTSHQPYLATQPGLLSALASSSLSAQQAATVGTYARGVHLARTVTNARAAGHTLDLTAGDQSLLDSINVPYGDVQITNQQRMEQYNGKLAAQGLQIKRDPKTGEVMFGASGVPLVEAKGAGKEHKDHGGGGGFWSGLGGVFHAAITPFTWASATVSHAVQPFTEAAHDVLGTVTGGPLGAGQAPDYGKVPGDLGQLFGGNPVTNPKASLLGASASEAADMRAAGYDPDNPVSVQAWRGSGHDYANMSKVEDGWDADHADTGVTGVEAVQLAKQYIDDAASTVADAINDEQVDPAVAAQRLKFLNSKPFQDLVLRVGSNKASLGTLAASAMGIDPVEHSTEWNIASAGADLAASFAIDPLLLIGKGLHAVKAVRVGVKAAGHLDPERITAVLTRDTTTGAGRFDVYTRNVQRGVDRFLDNAKTIREGGVQGASDAQRVEAAAAYRDIRATTPGLEPILQDVTGGVQNLTREGGVGVKAGERGPITGRGAPITNRAELATYLTSKLGYVKLLTGNAAIESAYMPGALSRFGYRKMRGALARTGTRKSAGVSLRDAKTAARMLPKLDDAIEADGRVVAAKGNLSEAQRKVEAARAAGGEGFEERQAEAAYQQADRGLDSARRAAREESNSAEVLSGEAQFNLSKRGTISGTGYNPVRAAATRAKRVSKLLDLVPGARSINLADPRSTDFVDKFARLFLTRGDAALFSSRWAAADAETRRAMIVGIERQVRHAAGHGHTEAGREKLAELGRYFHSPVTETGETSHRYSAFDRDIIHDPQFGNAPVHVGVGPEDVQETWSLPSYAELLRDGARYGIMGRVLGRVFLSRGLDHVTHKLKWATLIRPATASRIAVEAHLNMALRGEWGNAMAFRRYMRLQGKYPERLTGKLLDKAAAHVPSQLRFAPFASIADAYEQTALKAMSAEQVAKLRWLDRFEPGELEDIGHQFARAHMNADLDVGGQIQRARIYDAGGQPSQFIVNEQHSASPFKATKSARKAAGYAPLSLDGRAGLMLWHARMQHMIGEFPQYAKLRVAAAMRGGRNIEPLLKAIKADPELERLTNQLRGARVVDADDPALAREAITPEDYDKALRGQVRRQVAVTDELLRSRDGALSGPVAEYIVEHGRAPTPAWLAKNLPEEADRPAVALAPVWISKAVDKNGEVTPESIMAQMTSGSKMDKAYKMLIEDPANIMASLPAFLASYTDAREGLVLFEREMAGHMLATKLVGLERLLDGALTPAGTARRLGMSEEDITRIGGIHAGKFEAAESLRNRLRAAMDAELRTKGPETAARGQAAGVSDRLEAVAAELDAVEMRIGETFTPAEARTLRDLGELQYKLENALESHTGQIKEYGRQRKVADALVGRAHAAVAAAERRATEEGEPLLNKGYDAVTSRMARESAEAADTVMHGQALRQAWTRANEMLDDPGQRNQLDIIGRNFFFFSRATQTMLRRWGRTFYEDPFRLQKIVLGLNAAEHSGMIYQDKYGQWNFVYPGSGAFLNVMSHLASVIPGWGSLTQFPLSTNLSGRLLFAVPGVSDPLRMGLSPLVNLPFRLAEDWFPSARPLIAGGDRFINGPIGAAPPDVGQTFLGMMPAVFKHLLWDPFTPNERAARFASGTNASIANLAASDAEHGTHYLPGPGASPAEIQDFLDRIETQTRNYLFAQAVFGMYAPAPTGTPVPQTGASAADAAFKDQGIRWLKDEYTQIINDTGGDVARANQIWAHLHPDKLMYETAWTQPKGLGGSTPATKASLDWMEHNIGFIGKYGPTAAFFVPETEDTFNYGAYQIQLALGMRERRTPKEFYRAMQQDRYGKTYWDQWGQHKADTAALPSGSARKKELDRQWSAWSHHFQETHPIFKSSLVNFASLQTTAQKALGQMKDMVDDNNLPASVPVGKLKQLIGSYEAYDQWRHAHPGTTSRETAQKQAVASAFEGYVTQLGAGTPAITKIYNRVLRNLMPSLNKIGDEQ